MAEGTAKRAFYEEQIRLLQEKDIDGLIDSHYTDDAVLISFQNVIRGADALKVYFRGYVEMLGDIDVLSTDNFVEADEGIFFDATVKTKLGTVKVFDGWALRDGKISHHFTGVHP